MYKRQVLRDIGTMNVSTGTLTISATDGFAADASTSVRLTVIPNSLDIAPKRNQLLNIDPTRVVATAQVDTISTAGSSGSIDYTVNSRFR